MITSLDFFCLVNNVCFMYMNLVNSLSADLFLTSLFGFVTIKCSLRFFYCKCDYRKASTALYSHLQQKCLLKINGRQYLWLENVIWYFRKPFSINHLSVYSCTSLWKTEERGLFGNHFQSSVSVNNAETQCCREERGPRQKV